MNERMINLLKEDERCIDVCLGFSEGCMVLLQMMWDLWRKPNPISRCTLEQESMVHTLWLEPGFFNISANLCEFAPELCSFSFFLGSAHCARGRRKRDLPASPMRGFRLRTLASTRREASKGFKTVYKITSGVDSIFEATLATPWDGPLVPPGQAIIVNPWYTCNPTVRGH